MPAVHIFGEPDDVLNLGHDRVDRCGLFRIDLFEIIFEDGNRARIDDVQVRGHQLKMISFELHAGLDTQFIQKSFDAAGEADGQRSHRERIAAPPENIASSPDVRVLFQDQDSQPALGELGRAGQASDPRANDNGIVHHVAKKLSFFGPFGNVLA